MIIKTQDGWMIKAKSVRATISQVARIRDDFQGQFHIRHIANQLRDDGAIVADSLSSRDRVLSKAHIGLNQISSILNAEVRESSIGYKGYILSEGNGWFRRTTEKEYCEEKWD